MSNKKDILALITVGSLIMATTAVMIGFAHADSAYTQVDPARTAFTADQDAGAPLDITVPFRMMDARVSISAARYTPAPAPFSDRSAPARQALPENSFTIDPLDAALGDDALTFTPDGRIDRLPRPVTTLSFAALPAVQHWVEPDDLLEIADLPTTRPSTRAANRVIADPLAGAVLADVIPAATLAPIQSATNGLAVNDLSVAALPSGLLGPLTADPLSAAPSLLTATYLMLPGTAPAAAGLPL